MIQKWGLVATIKAPTNDILSFAAHHISLGAHRLHIYLDAPAPEAYAALKAHPKVRVIHCDDTYWAETKGRRPAKHQLRQTHNATRTYQKGPQVDWLIHMDVDEFLAPARSIADQLSELPADAKTARVRPVEQLAGSDRYFKGFIPSGPDRMAIVSDLYPTFGDHVIGGFLSHVAGKVFARTDMPEVLFKIHNVFSGDTRNPGLAELPETDLCHFHVSSWQDWRGKFDYRHKKGAYRSDLPGAAAQGGLSMHELFSALLAEGGEQMLRAFFDEVAADTLEHRARLIKHGLLREHDLVLAETCRKVFG